MKYSFMTFSAPELDLEEVLALAGRLGYDGVEPRTASGHRHGVELDADQATRREIKHKAADRGIALCCVATSCRYADPATAQEQVDETLRYVDLASDVGAPRLRVFGGKIPDGMDRAQAVDLLVESLGAIAGYVQDQGVTVCVETHDDWCDPKHVAEVMRGVNHAAVAVNWDIMHPVRVAHATMDAAFETLKPWIRHLHVHDGEAGGGPLRPIGEGVVDHKRAIQLLLAHGYDGYISGEWINWEPYEVHLPRELATLKRYEAEVSGSGRGPGVLT